jgi:hypothetical protein
VRPLPERSPANQIPLPLYVFIATQVYGHLAAIHTGLFRICSSSSAHFLLPAGDVPYAVPYDDEPSSIIAYALSCPQVLGEPPQYWPVPFTSKSICVNS